MAKKIVYLLFLALMITASGCERGPRVQWEAYTPEKMDQVLQSGRPVIVYFYAAWCGTCMKLKYETFSDFRVIQALEPLIRLKADMSFTHSPKVKEIAQRFDVESFPTIILFDSKGKQVARLRGFFDADHFLSELSQSYPEMKTYH